MAGAYDDQCAAVVVGCGPAGLTAAIALAEGGLSTLLVGKRPAKSDNRTIALLASSITALETLGVWKSCAAQAAPLKVMRIVDDTGRLWRAPEVKFDASEIGLEAFGYNIENRHLIDALEERARDLTDLRVIDGEALAITPERQAVAVAIKNGATYRAQLAIGADGGNSICRAAAGIGMDERDYPQVALTLCLRHSRPHHNTSTEFHTPSGPFTFVPLPGNRSSLVWVLDPGAADELADIDDAELSDEIERASYSILGKDSKSSRAAVAFRFVSRPHDGSQTDASHSSAKLRMSFRRSARKVSIWVCATQQQSANWQILANRGNQDIGSDDVLAHYDRLRRADVGSRTFAVDLLNRTLLSDLLPAQSARGLAFT